MEIRHANLNRKLWGFLLAFMPLNQYTAIGLILTAASIARP
ncbi:MAG TPA: hypothetical protein VF398_06940 [bacterium]|jgi:hypothetical protein